MSFQADFVVFKGLVKNGTCVTFARNRIVVCAEILWSFFVLLQLGICRSDVDQAMFPALKNKDWPLVQQLAQRMDMKRCGSFSISLSSQGFRENLRAAAAINEVC